MRDNGSKSLLAVAIDREEWELAALCLMIGVIEAAEKLPQETLDALLDELELEEGPPGRASPTVRAGSESGEAGMGTSDRWKQLVPPKRRRQVTKRSFYDDDCLSEAERIELRQAAKVVDLGEEIAVLRVRLKKALNERRDDYELLVRGVNVLVRAVAAQYRLSPRARRTWRTTSRRCSTAWDAGGPVGEVRGARSEVRGQRRQETLGADLRLWQ